MSRQTPRYVAFFFGTSLCPPTVITIFPALISRFVRAFPCPTASSKISNFPTLALRWLASKTSMTAWIHPVRCSHDLKMRNDKRSSTKAISFTGTSTSSPDLVALLRTLMDLSSVSSLRS